MPCGKTRPDQFNSLSEYESHRIKMMKIILGDDWEEKSLAQLVAENPELQQFTLQEMLHRAHHRLHELPPPQPAKPTIAEVIVQHIPTHDTRQPTGTPLAIEGSSGQTAADWLKQYLDPSAPEDAVVRSNKPKREGQRGT
jgi:hypothetical protein